MDNAKVIKNAIETFKARKDEEIRLSLQGTLNSAMAYALELHALDKGHHKAHLFEPDGVHYGWILVKGSTLISFNTDAAGAFLDNWAQTALQDVPREDLPVSENEWAGFLVADMRWDFLDWDWEVETLKTVKHQAGEDFPIKLIKCSRTLKRI